MAENRFDGLSKKLSTRFSRRTVLKGAGAAVGAGAVASVAGSAASAGSLFCFCSNISCPLIDPFGYFTYGWACAEERFLGGNYYSYNVRVQLQGVPPSPVSSYGVWLRLTENTLINGDRGVWKYLGQVRVWFGNGTQCWNMVPSIRSAATPCPTVVVGVGQGNNGPTTILLETNCCQAG